MSERIKFGSKGGKKYELAEFDKFNFVIYETYKSRAKGHEGKEVEKILGYYSCIDHALNELVRLHFDEAVILQKELKEATKELKDYYKENNVLKELVKNEK